MSFRSVNVNRGCPRCNGFLVVTTLELDRVDTSESLLPRALRCGNYGTMLDSKNLRNRSLTKEGTVSSDPLLTEVAEKWWKTMTNYPYY